MRDNFTDDEWTMLLQAPLQAVMGICLADRVDPVLFLQEVKSGIAIVAEELKRSDVIGELTPVLIGGLAEIDSADALQGEQLLLKKQFELLGLMQTFTSSKEGREHAIAHLQKVVSVLDAKVTGIQAGEFKQWLMSVAIKVAEAHREGGVMGIGSSRISDKENEVLKKMSAALGVAY
jgi:hypothetical protein